MAQDAGTPKLTRTLETFNEVWRIRARLSVMDGPRIDPVEVQKAKVCSN